MFLEKIKKLTRCKLLVFTYKGWKLLKFLGNRNSFFYLYHRFFTARSTIYLNTSVGQIAIRPKSSDIKVLYSSAVDEYPKLKSIIKAGAIFYDFGGYTGLSALCAKAFLKPKRIFVYEPMEENYKLLTYNVKDFTDIVSYNFGIGENSGLAAMSTKAGEDWGWSTFNNSVDETFTEFEKVHLEPLSSVDLDDAEFNFAKFDIEGAEKHIITENNFQTLKKFDAIFIETHEEQVPGITDKVRDKLKLTHNCTNLGDEKLFFSKKEAISNRLLTTCNAMI